MAMTEQQIGLVIAAKNGDVKSFEQLYTIYYDKVYGFARMILKNEKDAKDILQETFITAWRKLNTLETPATFADNLTAGAGGVVNYRSGDTMPHYLITTNTIEGALTLDGSSN